MTNPLFRVAMKNSIELEKDRTNFSKSKIETKSLSDITSEIKGDVVEKKVLKEESGRHKTLTNIINSYERDDRPLGASENSLKVRCKSLEDLALGLEEGKLISNIIEGSAQERDRNEKSEVRSSKVLNLSEAVKYYK